ncbi:MAG: peptide chain release factor N(5)-glutamine methyltransferase [Rhodocyclaceae bacterium]|nr:peptide chain release factor N(5)-glutamine methyltransferase [Rhodocyclaceae bacterium]
MAEPATLAAALDWARRQIDPVDARVLLCHVAGVSHGALRGFGERALPASDRQRFETLVRRRADGEPVAYLVGVREFYSRVFRVGSGVLIPRPETEGLVAAALDCVAGGDGLRALDLGTGSGVVAITLALELGRRAASVIAVDRSTTALAYASMNAGALGARIDFRLGDWYAGLDGQAFDVIVANPPYVADGDPHLASGDLRYEPVQALASGEDGLDAMRTIVAGAGAHLCEGGGLVVEHGHDQAAAVRRLMSDAGLANVRSLSDLAGIERVTVARRAVDAGCRRTVD